MIRCFNNSINEASFDFISNLIVLESREEVHKKQIEDIIKINIYDDSEASLDKFTIDILVTLYHELTHFLDMTTTVWGLQFIIRKTLLVNKKDDKSKEVFELSASEIELHNAYTKTFNSSYSNKLLECVTTHGIIYDEKHGALILLVFFKESQKVLETPISMLSVLETNAYCSEILTKIRCTKINPCIEEQIISMKMLSQDVDTYLNSNEDSEYKALFILAKKHFTFLNLEELCIFLKTLIQDVLNFEMELSIVSGVIHSSFINQSIGVAITHDLNRGMSRHIIVFKFILFIHGFINHHNDKKKLKEELKINPKTVISKFYKDFLNLHPMYKFNFDSSLELLKKQNLIFDTDFIIETIETNKSIVANNLDCMNNIKNYKLFDIYLGDMSIVSPPNRVDLYIDRYSEATDISYIDNVVKAKTIKKTHVHPRDVPNWYSI